MTPPRPPTSLEQLQLADLIALALRGDADDARAWDAVWELRRRGDEASVFEAATGLLNSASEKERGRGVDILAQLGSPDPDEALQAKCADAILGLLAVEHASTVLSSVGVALGHLQDPRAVEALVPFVRHADAEVRLGVVLGLMPHATPASVASLSVLSADVDAEVRDWATFGLATMEDTDSPELREALLARVADSDASIRGEALIGLARRGDRRVLEPVRGELVRRPVGVLAVEAAGLMGEAALLPLLLELQQAGVGDDYFNSVLRDAIAALGAAPASTES